MTEFIYISISYIFSFLEAKGHRIKRIWAELLIFVFFLIVGFQRETADYQAYNLIFDLQSFDFISYPYFKHPSLGLTGQEFIFSLLICLVKAFSGSFEVFIFIYFFIFYLIVRKVVLNQKLRFSILLLLGIMLLPKALTQWRHAFVILLSLFFILNMKKSRFFLIPLISFNIHALGIITFTYRIVDYIYKKLGLFISVTILVLGALSLTIAIGILQPYLPFLSKLDSDTQIQYSISEKLILFTFLLAIVSVTILNYKSSDKLSLLIVLISFVSLFVFNSLPVFAGRIYEMMIPSAMAYSLSKVQFPFSDKTSNNLMIFNSLMITYYTLSL